MPRLAAAGAGPSLARPAAVARPLLLSVASSSSPSPAPPAPANRPLPGHAPCRAKSGGFFDRLIPEDDPKLREFKERERRVIKEQFSRGKISDAMRLHKDKVGSTGSS